MNVHRNNVVDVNDFGAARFRVSKESLELEEACGRHKLQNVIGRHLQVVASTTV